MNFSYTFLFFIFITTSISAQTFDPKEYIIENEIGKEEPAPHKGGGNSVGFTFFKDATDFKTVFKKRILKPDAAIGHHTQKEDEVYYIISGTGSMLLNNKLFTVKTGDAILTRTGASHSLKNSGKEDLEIIIVYEK